MPVAEVERTAICFLVRGRAPNGVGQRGGGTKDSFLVGGGGGGRQHHLVGGVRATQQSLVADYMHGMWDDNTA